MGFVKYTHVERLGHPNVNGLLLGKCYVFPKLDGANASIWSDRENGGVCCGSRRRDLSQLDAADNHGFRSAMEMRWSASELDYIQETYDGVKFPIFYGEWLVPHSLKTYRPEAWREFYIFDVRCPDTGRYLHYDTWADRLREAGAKVLEPLQIINNPTEEDIIHVRDTTNTYLIAENSGVGEGVVVKNYDFVNHVGKTVWGKSVRNDFKEENRREMGSPEREGSRQVEKEIAEEFVTQALVEKTRAKVTFAMLIEENDERWSLGEGLLYDQTPEALMWLESVRGRLIPRLLSTVFHELVDEEAASFVKKFKDPTIDFKKLRQFSIVQTKKFAADLF